MLTIKYLSRFRLSNVLIVLIFTIVLAAVSLLLLSDTQAGKPPKTPKPAPGGDLEIVTSVLDFSSRRCKPLSNFLLMTADGSTTKNLLRECECILFDPSWSPDGSRIVYVAYPYMASDGCSGGYGLNTVKNDGKDIRHILTDQDVFQPAWSPELSIESSYWIAYYDENGSGGINDIYMIPVDTLGDPIGARINLTETDLAREWDPTWSSDADSIAYIRRDRSSAYPGFKPSTIIIRDLTSYPDTVEYVIDGPYPDYGTIGNIDWARTGDKFVIVTNEWSYIDEEWVPGPAEIWIVDFTTDSVVYTMLVGDIVCCGNGLSISPSWSSDDTQIVYQTNDGIWVCNSDGTGTPTQISDEGYAGSPDWRR